MLAVDKKAIIRMRQPLLIFVSGAPGAGKSTLAHSLAQYLRILHIPRDEVLRGIEMTHGGPIDRREAVDAVYYPQLIQMLKANISIVTDGTIYKGISERDIKRYLVPNAVGVNIHVRAKNEHQRFLERELQREGWSAEWAHDYKKRLDEIYDQAVDPLDLGMPLIEVDATNGYLPLIPDIVREIRKIYTDTRLGIKVG